MYNEPRIYAYSFAACAYVRGRLWNPPGSDLNPSPPLLLIGRHRWAFSRRGLVRSVSTLREQNQVICLAACTELGVVWTPPHGRATRGFSVCPPRVLGFHAPVDKAATGVWCK